MTYFAHSTIVMYAKEIICSDGMTPPELYERNEAIMQRVFDEGINIMGYELSHRQMMIACYTYLSSKYHPQSVSTTEAFKLD